MIQSRWLKRRFKLGSKSFYVAALFFDAKTRHAASALYAYCRYCDDQIDLVSPVEQAPNLNRMVELTRLSYARPPGWEEHLTAGEERETFLSFASVVERYSIPIQYPLDLLEGMRMDVQGTRYRDLNDLERYCYCVAGTVGAMMAHVMRATGPMALYHAIQLGIALQLVNIARDVQEDLGRSRIYLPENWLHEERAGNVSLPDKRFEVFRVVQRLLDAAQKYEEVGLRGLRFLKLRSAFAVLAAVRIYSRIGKLVLTRGPEGLQNRVVVPAHRKFLEILQTIPYLLYWRWRLSPWTTRPF